MQRTSERVNVIVEETRVIGSGGRALDSIHGEEIEWDGAQFNSHRDLETVLCGFNAAYNGRRQRVLKGLSPEMVLRQRLEAIPALINPRHRPPHRGSLEKARRIVADANEVSQPDS